MASLPVACNCLGTIISEYELMMFQQIKFLPHPCDCFKNSMVGQNGVNDSSVRLICFGILNLQLYQGGPYFSLALV